jgi:hypothetical protein
MSINEYKQEIEQILKAQYNIPEKEIAEMLALDHIREELFMSYELYGNKETKVKGIPQTVAKRLLSMR